jgi:hypothetical protein
MRYGKIYKKLHSVNRKKQTRESNKTDTKLHILGKQSQIETEIKQYEILYFTENESKENTRCHNQC